MVKHRQCMFTSASRVRRRGCESHFLWPGVDVVSDLECLPTAGPRDAKPDDYVRMQGCEVGRD